jgi:hypothetical protein
MLQYRQIFLDGRRLPINAEPMFKGYSVGKWNGDTLVVETIGLKDGGWLDLLGHPLTDQARIMERIRRVNYGNLQVEMTVDDPKALQRPFSIHDMDERASSEGQNVVDGHRQPCLRGFARDARSMRREHDVRQQAERRI